MTDLTFYGIREAVPGPRWRQLFDATWAGYRSWFLADGDAARPGLDVGRRKLRQHMPELVPTWERLVELTDGEPTAARMLTLYDPPRFLPGCSQLVLTGDRPLLVRNYDYRPDLCERVVYSSAFTGRRVIGSSDCLWGLLDGMNDAGLVVSLTAVPGAAPRPGFGVPLVVRYLLETAETVAESIAVLTRVPISQAYNLTLLDRRRDTVTVYVAPGARPEVSALPAATNHRGTVPDDPAHARSLQSVERQQALLALHAAHRDAEAVVDAFLRHPLHRTEYDRGFGTMYTAVYRPDLGVVDYVWPGSRWRRAFDSPDAVHTVAYSNVDEPGPTGRSEAMVDGKQPGATPAELSELAETAVLALARTGGAEAFDHLLRLTRITGESLGTAARSLADHSSWAGVADLSGTTRQAAWDRWRTR